MPFAINPVDGARTYFEDDGGSGPSVVFFAGLADPLAYCRTSGLARALSAHTRLIFADHRGHGRSDKPHDVAAYALPLRVADVVAVLDALHIGQAHFVGFSWGARLGFAMGEHAPQRVASLVLCGNQPYAWEPDWPLIRAASDAIAAGIREGMEGFARSLESYTGEPLGEPARSWVLDNDPAALDAAWRSALTEGPISRDLSAWRVPCLIYAGTGDDMHDSARRAAAAIPGAIFVSVPGHTHMTADREVERILPHVLALLRSEV